jgi:outer membrane receptor protein involved in Fe transport
MNTVDVKNGAGQWLYSGMGAGLVIVLLCVPLPSRADDASAADAQLQEVVVTAEKRNSTVQSIPMSISAVTGDELQAQGISSVAGVAAEIPGISMRTSGPGQTELEMRGMASGGGSSPTVGFYLDETPLTPPAASLNGKVVIDPDLFDLNRVEVLRGPQGTLYGAGSMGGTIKLVTNQPDLEKFSGQAEGIMSGTDGGGFNPTGNLMLNIPLINDELALRVVGTEKYVSGWIDRIVVSPFPEAVDPCSAYSAGTTTGCVRGNVLAAGTTKQVIPDVNWEWLQGARSDLLWKPYDALTVDTLIMYQRVSTGGYNEYDTPPGIEPTLAHYQPFNTGENVSDRFALYSLTVKYDASFAELTSNTSYWSRKESNTQDISEALRSDFEVFYGVDILAPITFTEIDYSTQLSEELRLTSKDEGRFQWIAGAFYSKLTSTFVDINQAAAFAAASVGGAPANPQGIVYDANNPYRVAQYAIFGEATYQLSDSWKLTTGLRYLNYSTHVDEQQEGSLTASGNATPTTAQFSTSASGVTPKVSLAYEPSKDLTLYTSVSKGVRPGGVNLPLPPFCQATTETYAPDSAWNYELGEKARLLDNRISINADAFMIKWSNVQQLINQACGYSLTANAGDAKSYGTELEFNANLTPFLRLGVSGAETKAYLSSINPVAAQVASTPLLSGTPILNIPKYTESTSLTYTRPLNDQYALIARATNSYVGPSTDTSFSYTNLSPYDIVGLRAGLKRDSLSGYLFIDNLTNKHAELSTNTTSFSWIVPSVTRVATNQPMTFGVDFTYSF